MIPALLPPPLTTSPFLLAAGALQYPRGKFLTALTLGRSLRYFVLGYLSARYGRFIIGEIRLYHRSIIIAGIAIAVGVAAYIFLERSGRSRLGY